MINVLVVSKGKTKSGIDYVVRYPIYDDAKAMLDYINALSREQTTVNLQGDQKTLEEEQKFLEDELKRISEHKSVLLLALLENKVIGISNISLNAGASKHIGELGISIGSAYRGQGIGKLLMTHLLNEAKKNIPQLEIISLSLFGVNSQARALYDQFGFEVYGKLPKGLLRKGEYSDRLYMFKRIR